MFVCLFFVVVVVVFVFFVLFFVLFLFLFFCFVFGFGFGLFWFDLYFHEDVAVHHYWFKNIDLILVIEMLALLQNGNITFRCCAYMNNHNLQFQCIKHIVLFPFILIKIYNWGSL